MLLMKWWCTTTTIKWWFGPIWPTEFVDTVRYCRQILIISKSFWSGSCSGSDFRRAFYHACPFFAQWHETNSLIIRTSFFLFFFDVGFVSFQGDFFPLLVVCQVHLTLIVRSSCTKNEVSRPFLLPYLCPRRRRGRGTKTSSFSSFDEAVPSFMRFRFRSSLKSCNVEKKTGNCVFIWPLALSTSNVVINTDAKSFWEEGKEGGTGGTKSILQKVQMT